MVYKIRSKSFFWTRAGWKNNWHPKSFNAPRPTTGEQTMAIRCRYDHMSFLRANHSYRMISRHCKQYFYGDKKLEEVFILGLRSFFLVPLVCETHTDLIKHGGERRMVDQLDRDFELVSYNQHPFQLFTYELNNKNIAYENDNYTKEAAGEATFEQQMFQSADQYHYIIDTASEATFEQQMLKYADECIKEAEAKQGDGQKLSVERLTEVVLQCFRKARAESQRPSQDSRNPNGSINDYMEQRRPFLAPSPNSHST